MKESIKNEIDLNKYERCWKSIKYSNKKIIRAVNLRRLSEIQ
jgi:transposase